MSISWNTVIFKLRSIFETDERWIMSGIAFHFNALGNPVEPCFFCWHGSMTSPQNTTMKGHSQHNPSLIAGKNQVKFENDCVLTDGHRIKITQSNLMIFVSFSSTRVAWFEDVKRYGTCRSQATENLPFRFLWDTRYIVYFFIHYHLKSCSEQKHSGWISVLFHSVSILYTP